MARQITQQPKCSKKQVGKAGKSPSTFEKTGWAKLQAVKSFIAWALVRPATWRFFIVHLPEVIDKARLFLKDAITFFTDLF